MKIKQGSTRFVVQVGVVVFKFPKIRFLGCLKDCFLFLFKKEERIFLKIYFCSAPFSSSYPGLWYNLFQGIISNFKEYMFWKKYKNSFCEPTYFSLMGLLNIQRFSPAYDRFDTKDFWNEMQMVKNYDWDDGHHFSNPENFNIRDGKLLIVDYSDERTHRVILKHGQNIIKHFAKL